MAGPKSYYAHAYTYTKYCWSLQLSPKKNEKKANKQNGKVHVDTKIGNTV